MVNRRTHLIQQRSEEAGRTSILVPFALAMAEGVRESERGCGERVCEGVGNLHSGALCLGHDFGLILRLWQAAHAALWLPLDE